MSSRRLEIELSEGVLSGVQEKLPNGENFYAFRGVPYAQPPVGNLRFKVNTMFELRCAILILKTFLM